VSNLKEAVFRAGFDFARRLVDADFRQFLKTNGWRNGEHIVMSVVDEPAVDVINKVMLHSGSKAFIAIADDREHYGFRLLTVEVVKVRKRDRILFRRPDAIHLDPATSIGMLYSALHPAGTYAPSEWTMPLRFEKVAA